MAQGIKFIEDNEIDLRSMKSKQHVTKKKCISVDQKKKVLIDTFWLSHN